MFVSSTLWAWSHQLGLPIYKKTFGCSIMEFDQSIGEAQKTGRTEYKLLGKQHCIFVPTDKFIGLSEPTGLRGDIYLKEGSAICKARVGAFGSFCLLGFGGVGVSEMIYFERFTEFGMIFFGASLFFATFHFFRVRSLLKQSIGDLKLELKFFTTE